MHQVLTIHISIAEVLLFVLLPGFEAHLKLVYRRTTLFAMPRAAPPNSCATCLQRKVKCDGQRPVCRNCAIKGRDCTRPVQKLRFVIANSEPKLGPNEVLGEIGTCSGDGAIQSSVSPDHLATLESGASSTSSTSLQRLASEHPSIALEDTEIAALFIHYIIILAPWYDLNDPHRTFALEVPETSLQTPILFKAIVAFSACHLQKTTGAHGEAAAAFHAACVTELLNSISTPDASPQGAKLAATCLLRSYELIKGNLSLESHLLGAYSYATSGPIDFLKTGILQIGAWNYLREEITVGLIERRGVRMSGIFDDYVESHPEDVLPPDAISYLLGKIINYSFAHPAHQLIRDRQEQWQSLKSALELWKARLPASYAPFSHSKMHDNPFPSLWMLQPCHIAAQQYLAIAEMLLILDSPSLEGDSLSQHMSELVEDQALRICGLTWTSSDEAAWVNSFGPMAFCGRFLRQQRHREGIEQLLRRCSRPTGWPVDAIISDLRKSWTQVH